MSNNQVGQSGSLFFPDKERVVHPSLPIGVYTFQWDQKGNMFLEHVGEDFKLPKKLYLSKVDKLLIKSVKNSWINEDRNLGLLLSGVKGQGKTITAKAICNDLKLPVIVINKSIPIDIDFVQFLSRFEQDLIIFVDEFEKLFGDDYDSDKNSMHSQKAFLSFTDGTFTNSKRLFMFTTNTKVSEYFMNRPSRVRFVRKYGHSIDEEVFKEILDDLVKDPALRKDIEDNLDISNCTVDILMQIIRESENQEALYSEFASIFNYTPPKKVYDVEILNNDKVVYKASLETLMSEDSFNTSYNCWITIPVDGKLCKIAGHAKTLDDFADTYVFEIEEGNNINSIVGTKVEEFIKNNSVEVTVRYTGPYSSKVSKFVI